MEFIPTIHRITIYPVKSLDGMSMQKAKVVKGGCLHHDREYAIFNKEEKLIIGKTNPLVHLLRSTAEPESNVISFRYQNEANWNSFHLQNEKEAVDKYLSDFFGKAVHLYQNKEGRFLDIPDISGITVLSTTSLETVSGWFTELDLEETRKRFRATIEIGNVPAFWEDRLFLEEGTAIECKAGDVTIFGISPRERCIVPTRNTQTGEVIHAFPKIFAKNRLAHLPQWSTLQDYDHGYYLTVNCYIPPTEAGKWLNVGDSVKIIGKKYINRLFD